MKIKYLILLAVSGSVLALDQLTKLIVKEKMYYGETISVISNFFNLTYVRNPGAAFGMLGGLDASYRIPFFIIMPIVALGVIFYIFRGIADSDRRVSVALSLVVGGACGNLIDRAAYNYVIDFLDFHYRYQVHFPAFNVADSAICVGVGLLFLDMFKRDQQNDPSKESAHVSSTH